MPSHLRFAPDAGRPFAIGFGVAMAACLGIAAERLSQGAIGVALLGHVLLTAAVLLALHVHRRDRESSRIWPQIVGAALAMGLVHASLAHTAEGHAWLSERPAQLVNDLVAVAGALTVAWAASRRPPRTAALIATLLLVTIYRATAGMWHLDAASFAYSVQNFVAGSVAGSALGVAAFRMLVPL